MKRVPILNDHNGNELVLGFVDMSLDLENLLKGGVVTLGGSYIEYDGTTELVEVSVLPSSYRQTEPVTNKTQRTEK